MFSLTTGSYSENNSIADLQSDEREESPDLLANFIHDTTKKLQNLTNELNNHATDDFHKLTTKHGDPTDNNGSSATTEDLNNSCYQRREENGSGAMLSLNDTTADCAYVTKLQNLFAQTPSASATAVRHKDVPHDLPKSLENSHNGVQNQLPSKGITIEKNSQLRINLMQSVELEGECNQ